MPFVHENVKVELFPGAPSPIVYLSENDVGDTIVFELVYKGQPVNVPDGSVVKFKGTKKNGLGFTVDSNDISDNVVEFIVSEDMTSCSGVVEAEISITLNNNKHGTCNVVLIVEKNPHSDGTQDGSYPQIVSEMRELVDQIEGDAEIASNAANTAVAAKNSALEIQQDVRQYTASAIDNWLDEHPEATTTVQDGSLTLAKFARVENPDNYTGTDAEKLASAINAMPTGGIVLLDRDYELTSNVIITRGSGAGRVIVKSINKNATINCNSYEFTSEGATFGSYGGIIFDGIRFVGTGNLIDGKYLIRIFFCNCYITGFNHVVYSSATNNVHLQTIYFINCMIRQIKGYILDVSADSGLHWLYDIRVNNSVIEWSYGLINARAWQGVYIDNNAIEGFTGNVPVFDDIQAAYASSVSNNYFEKNAGTTIDFSKATERNDITIDISNNLFMQDTQTEGAIIILPMLKTGGCINIQDNIFRLANPTNAYGIKVMDEVTEVLSNCNITGNVATLYDPNNKIKNVKSLSELYAEELYKISNVVDQSVNATHVMSIPVIGVALNSSLLRTSVPFPFETKNTDYLIDIINLDFTNLGNVASNTEVYAKKIGGIITSTTGSFTQNTVYSGAINIRITFK